MLSVSVVAVRLDYSVGVKWEDVKYLERSRDSLYTWRQLASSFTHIHLQYESFKRHTEAFCPFLWKTNVLFERLSITNWTPCCLRSAYRWELLRLSSYQVWQHSQMRSQILPEVLAEQLPVRICFHCHVTHISEWPMKTVGWQWSWKLMLIIVDRRSQTQRWIFSWQCRAPKTPNLFILII